MKKYWIFFRQNAYEFFAYRLRVLFSVFSYFIAPLMMTLVFLGLPDLKIADLSKEELVNYYLFSSIFFLFMGSSIDNFVKDSIYRGGLAPYLLKPARFWLVAFAKDSSLRVIRFFVGLPFLLLLTFFIGNISLSFLSPISVTLLLVLVSFLLAFSFAFSLGLFAFWTEDLWGFQNLKEVSILLLSGVLLPYQFFPASLQAFLKWTPFPYLVNWPLRKGFSGNLMDEILIAALWLMVFALLGTFLWKKGIKKYSAMGVY